MRKVKINNVSQCEENSALHMLRTLSGHLGSQLSNPLIWHIEQPDLLAVKRAEVTMCTTYLLVRSIPR
jgi:hypothetical protein